MPAKKHAVPVDTSLRGEPQTIELVISTCILTSRGNSSRILPPLDQLGPTLSAPLYSPEIRAVELELPLAEWDQSVAARRALDSQPFLSNDLILPLDQIEL